MKLIPKLLSHTYKLFNGVLTFTAMLLCCRLSMCPVVSLVLWSVDSPLQLCSTNQWISSESVVPGTYLSATSFWSHRGNPMRSARWGQLRRRFPGTHGGTCSIWILVFVLHHAWSVLGHWKKLCRFFKTLFLKFAFETWKVLTQLQLQRVEEKLEACVVFGPLEP